MKYRVAVLVNNRYFLWRRAEKGNYIVAGLLADGHNMAGFFAGIGKLAFVNKAVGQAVKLGVAQENQVVKCNY